MSTSFTSIGDSADAVFFLHGVGSGKEGWEAQADATVDADWRFVALDAPGFGETPMPVESGFGPHVDAILEVNEKESPSRVVLCGHSMGGMTAQEFYAHHPKRVSGLILSGTSPAFGKPDGDFQKEFLRARFEPFDKGMTMSEYAEKFSANLLGPDPDEGALQKIIDVMSAVSIEAYRLAIHTIAGFNQRDNLANIDVPTMLVAGEHDKNAPAKMMAKMAQHIEGSQYVELPTTGHMAPIENVDAFNFHLQTFLKELG